MKRVIDFDSTLNTFRGPIVDWCKSLRNSTIYEIQLLSSSSRSSDPAPHFVVVSLQDGSMYRLQRTAKWVKKQIMPNIQDTIEKVSALDIGRNSQPLVTIKFKQHYYPNLLFLLRVCHGIQKHGIIFKAPHVVMDCSDNFFALALVLNVTRNCLPRRSVVDTSQSDSCILLERLWQELYQSLQRQGYAFWERTIAEHTKSLARELIYRLARYKVLQLFGGKEDPVEGPSIAASTVARIEALVEKKELMDPTVWDKAWDLRWKEVWKQYAPVVHSRNMGGIQTFAGINTISAIVDGRGSGRAAGRTPVKLSSTESSGALLLNAILARAHSQPPGRLMHNTRETSTQGGASESVNPITNNEHHSLTEVVVSNLYRVAVTERYDCALNWLGNSCLISNSNAYKVWATPWESAIESAWVVAWSEGESCGRDAARSILKVNGSVDQPHIQPTSAVTRSRAHTFSKAVVRIAVRASQRLSISLNREHSQDSPATAIANTDGLAEVLVDPGTPLGQASLATTSPSLGANPPAINNRILTPSNIISEFETSSPLAVHPQFEGNRLSPVIPRPRKASGASSKQRPPSTPTGGLHPIWEASSRVDLTALSPATGIAEGASKPFPVASPVQATTLQNSDSSVPPSGITSPRPRSESATKRLRKHVITRWSDPQPYRDFEAAFVDKAQERKYRESKESSCKKAAQCVRSLALLKAKLQEVDIMKHATDAWDRANSISAKVPLQQKLKALAQQEWEKLVDEHGTDLGDQPNIWESGFVSAWERAWKKSWVAAWAAVWSQSFNEAVSRGIEFGFDEIIDNLDPDLKLKRKTYERIESSNPYRELRQSLLDNTSPLGSLEQIHQWMKELSYLSELLHYSVPTLRDECMEITVFESKTKAPPTLMGRLGVTEVKIESMKMSYYKLQEWLAEDYIFQKVHHDKEVHNLFLRGIEEVWESVSEMNQDGRVEFFE